MQHQKKTDEVKKVVKTLLFLLPREVSNKKSMLEKLPGFKCHRDIKVRFPRFYQLLSDLMRKTLGL